MQNKYLHNKSLRKLLIYSIFSFLLLGSSISCKKLVQISPSPSMLTIAQVFGSDDEATSAIAGLYSKMINTSSIIFGNGAITIYTGLSADEFALFNQTSSDQVQFQKNNLISSNLIANGSIWAPGYLNVYQANAVIEGLEASTSVSDSVKKELIGEAKFVRAFCNFYLTNLFGSIPLVTTTNWNNTNLLSRSDTSQVYKQIISDLLDAQAALPGDYSVGGGYRVRPNKWAATALLARTYLYLKDWDDANTQASSIIGNTSLYSLVPSLAHVFDANSTEAIWQLMLNPAILPYNATPEGNQLLPRNRTSQPFVYLTKQLLNAFENGDNRKATWTDSTKYLGVVYYYPNKYTIGPGTRVVNGSVSQYYMMMRLAEQYLIRAEAEAQKGDIPDAESDLNTIRVRAGLAPVTRIAQTDLLDSIAQERKVEFFSEWGHRWLDLKRTGMTSEVLSINKMDTVTNNDRLYPIPLSEIQKDPNLTQNNGY